MSQIPTKVPPGPGFRARLIAFCSKQWPRYLFLGAIGFVVRLPALQGQLIWDDAYLARDNPFIKSPLLALEAFRHYLFLDSFSGHYRPVQNLSFMVDYFFWNADLTGFHLTNILLHVASGLLLYRLLTLLFRDGGGLWKIDGQKAVRTGPLAALIISAIWMVHPVHSAAIDYISGRADSLAFLFAAAAWLLVLRARTANSSWSKFTLYVLAAFSALLALCSRETACIWLFIFLLHTLGFAKGVAKKSRIVTVICCLFVFGIYAELHQLPGARQRQGADDNWPPPVRAVLMLRALGDYGRLLVYPANLHMERTVLEPDNYRDRDFWRRSAGAEYLSILGLGVFAVLVFGCVKAGPGQRARLLGAIWFVAAYLPISNIIQLNATVAEHWLYLPSVGLLIFLAGCTLELSIGYQRALALIAAGAVIIFGVRSFARSGDWVNEETFYQRTFESGSRSARVAVNLAQIYASRGLYADAERMFRLVVKQNPDYPIAQNNLASVLYREGKTKEAENLYVEIEKKSVETRKEYARTWIGALNLALVRDKAGEREAAVTILERARRDYPEVWELISLEGEILRQTQRSDEALRLVEGFARANWWHHAAWLAAGRLYAAINDVPRSIQALRYAALLDVHDVESLNLLAQIFVHENHLEEARIAQSRAVAREPNQPRQYLMLAEILDKMERTSEAQTARDDATRLKAIVTSPRIAAN
jgi:tetratricopeptide (TPR) repeat protein